MNKLIDQFPFHLKRGLSTMMVVPPNKLPIDNIVIAGMGGSGIGAEFIKSWINNFCKVPVYITKDYHIPHFVNENTLFLASSYSGNTEETLQATMLAEKKGAFLAVVSSGGQLLSMAKTNNWAFIQLPENIPAPRAAVGFSITAQLRMIHAYSLLDKNIIPEINDAICSLIYWKDEIVHQAQLIANKMEGKIPVIYTSSEMEPVALRFRQQIAENSKCLAWHNVIPEMNHNELVGWTTFNPNLVSIFIRSSNEGERTQLRMKITQNVVAKYTANNIELWPKGRGLIGESLYMIHLLDWVSYYCAEQQGVDVMEIDVINHLKGRLSTFHNEQSTKVA